MSNQQHSFKKECWHLDWQMYYLFTYICLSVYALILDRIRSFRNVGGKFSILARKESRIWLGFFSTHLGLESKNEVDDILLFGMSQLPVYVCVSVCCVYQSANPRTKFRPQPCRLQKGKPGGYHP